MGSASQHSCLNCGTHTTPQWRSGPDGPRTLCNACGVRHKKGLPLEYRLTVQTQDVAQRQDVTCEQVVDGPGAAVPAARHQGPAMFGWAGPEGAGRMGMAERDAGMMDFEAGDEAGEP